MSTDHLEERLDAMRCRLREVYDGIGHSSGRPYLYFVYAPEKEPELRRLVGETLLEDDFLRYIRIDLLPLTIASLANQEEKRTQLLNDPTNGSNAALSIVRLWARRLHKEAEQMLATTPANLRPVLILQGLAALHPIGNPTSLMESVAENELRDLHTGKIVPIILFVPGFRPPQTSREYQFLSPESEPLTFYRGEEI